MAETYTEIPNWIIIVLPIVTTLLGLGAAWGVYRATTAARIQKNEEAIVQLRMETEKDLLKLNDRVAVIEHEDRQTALKISGIKQSLATVQEGIDWIKAELRSRRKRGEEDND